jgi:hypothetical protein
VPGFFLLGLLQHSAQIGEKAGPRYQPRYFSPWPRHTSRPGRSGLGRRARPTCRPPRRLPALPRRLGAFRSHNAPRSTGHGWFRLRGTGTQLAAEIGAATGRHLNGCDRHSLHLRLHCSRTEVAQQPAARIVLCSTRTPQRTRVTRIPLKHDLPACNFTLIHSACDAALSYPRRCGSCSIADDNHAPGLRQGREAGCRRSLCARKSI